MIRYVFLLGAFGGLVVATAVLALPSPAVEQDVIGISASFRKDFFSRQASSRLEHNCNSIETCKGVIKKQLRLCG